ncbi:hypothetical protein T4B_4784 [Trichinella pseudospiralis]|uniref:Uncharacterized protein n=1 Tax=Trichinella pseudospiralis TaxID=6337 RepID=A0A0V1GJ39_TRIPS|nr:hypothetical protein T4B_4784 [Trichinella pseudospiralis]
MSYTMIRIFRRNCQYFNATVFYAHSTAISSTFYQLFLSTF